MNKTTANVPENTTQHQEDPVILPDINMYGTLIWVPLGIILNTLSLITLIKCKNFTTSIGNYLKSLSVADNLLIIGLFCMSIDDHWKAELNVPAIGRLNDVACSLSVYTVQVGFLTSGLILASATIERFCTVAFPLKFHSSNFMSLNKIVISFVFTFALAISIIFAIGTEISPKNGQCRPKPSYKAILKVLFLITQTIISNGLCGAIILIFTIVIIILLFHQKKRRNELSNSGNSEQREFQITIMLITATSLFLVLRLPKIVSVLIFFVKPAMFVQSWSNFGTLLFIVNHSINFFIYFTFLQSFRKTFLQMFRNLFCHCQGIKVTRGPEEASGTQNAIVEAREYALKVFIIDVEN